MKRRERYTTRDPEPVARDPVPEPPEGWTRKKIDVPQPATCPNCKGKLIMDGGKRKPSPRCVYEYRTCRDCGRTYTGVRPAAAFEMQ